MDAPHQAPEPFPIPDSDEELLSQCRVETFTAGGKGGQHQNRSETGVRFVHLPTGLVATARDERSQHRNRVLALERLRRKLEAHNHRPEPRIRTRIPPREKRRRLEKKKKRGRTKVLRKKPQADPEA